ncbi:MAG: ATP-binding cassette domain-containing protein [Desulfobacterales bacterium]
MIHVENLTKYYGDFCAVDHIDLDIQKGEVLGLLGPNGAGKSTTLRMLTGYFPPTAGTICVKDLSIDADLLAIKRLIGYLPESAPLYHDMLVYDYLDYVADIRGIEKRVKHSRIKQLATLCGLNHIMHNVISELSRGLKQRVGLAHAMMDDPEILILDEPTSGLDPNQIVEIRDIIRGIGKEKTVILSTHILSEAEATCDRVVVINRGKIVADGSVDMLRQASGNQRFVNLSFRNADYESVKKKLESIDGVTGIEAIDEKEADMLSVRLEYVSDVDLRERIYQEIKGSEWVLMALQQETKSLELIFRELTSEN